MTTRWFSTVSLIAALLLGYSFFITGDQPSGIAVARAEITDYTIKDAVISETDDSGAMRIHFVAKVAIFNSSDDALTLRDVRVDYQPTQPVDDGTSSADSQSSPLSSLASAHWVVTSDNGARAANDDIVTLSGNVVAHSDGTMPLTLITESLALDLTKQTATSAHSAKITVGQHLITGNQLQLNLPKQQLYLSNGGQIRLAASKEQQLDATSKSSATKINPPDIFEYDDLSFYDDTLHLTKVHSKVPPYVWAEEAIASGADLSNNRFVLKNGVRFELPQQGQLTADSAIVTVRNSHITYATVSALPTTNAATADQKRDALIAFEHRPVATKESEAVLWRGRAQSIDYDVDASTLLLRGGWLTRLVNNTPQFESDCPSGIYNIAKGEGRCTKVDQQRPTTIIHLPEDNKSLDKFKGKLPPGRAP